MIQKEESLDKKTENLEKKEEKLARKQKAVEDELAEAERIKNSHLEVLENISGFTKEQAKTLILEKIDEERIAVSKKLGYEVESVRKWLERVYDVKGETLYESIQNTVPYQTIEAPNSLDNRYITEDVPNGLVPLESTGHSLGLEMKYTGIIIELANILLNRDFRSEGRNLKKIFRDDQSKIDEFLKRSEVSE